MLAAFLVSSAQVSHLSLASSLLTGGTCPQVPLRISQPLFKSISMLNSCWREEAGWTPWSRMGSGGGGRGRDVTMNYNSFTPLTLQADPQPLSCSLSLSVSLFLPPSPLLVWPFITLCSPLWLFFSFISFPVPLSLFFSPFLFQSLTSILPAQPRACSHFR